MGHIGSRRALRHGVAVVALAVGVTAPVACSAGSANKPVALKAAPGAVVAPDASSGAAAAGPGTDGAGPVAGGIGQPAPGPANAAATAAAPGAPARATPSGSATTTATTRPAVTGSKPTTPPDPGPAPVTPGTYSYKLLSGSSVLTTGSNSTPLTVADPSQLTVGPPGSGIQQWVNSSTTSNLQFNGSGVFLLSETVPLLSTTCTFNQPGVPSPPWPLAVGKAFSGQATCGSSTSMLILDGKVTGTASMQLDGAPVSTFLVQTALHLSDNSVVIAETDWYAPSLRLPVKSIVVVKGGVSGYSIASTTTYVLMSSRPS